MKKKSTEKEFELDQEFGYFDFYDFIPKDGWLLNYHSYKNENNAWKVAIYFVDDNCENFKIALNHYPSLIVETSGDILSVEDYLKKKYEGFIETTMMISKIDLKEFNHLNKTPKNFLKIYFKTESCFQQISKELRELTNKNNVKKYEGEIYSDFSSNRTEDISLQINSIHEYDIPIDVQIANDNGIRAGCWYKISYDGKEYSFVKQNKLTIPDLRIFAFDIETTKPPLKFPNADNDKVMMISILTDDFGELIVNRNIVSKDIQEFEYHAKDDMKSNFRVSNETTEESLLIRFIEIIQDYKPHIITTFNGGFFDWPFIDNRMKKYNISLENTLQYSLKNSYYDCPFMIHLDCYKWVQRDSYLPMNNQGLKDVTRIKLGYDPDEIDPEDMVLFAKDDPQKLASYSVSDAIATFHLYYKFVHPHIYSICSLIPTPPVQALCKGSGTLCEALLISEAISYGVLIPPRKKIDGLEYYEGHIAENLTYIGGHVESLKAGIFRSDFDTEFIIDEGLKNLIINNFDFLLPNNIPKNEEYVIAKNNYLDKIRDLPNKVICKGKIYHLDVGAMYPNIILTNRLQPVSIVDQNICIRCDYNNAENKCKKKMDWISKADFLPAEKTEISMIRNQLEHENFFLWDNENSKKVPYTELPSSRQDFLLKERVLQYSKNIYKRSKKTEIKKQELTVCQREVPFYVETVRKFRDQRYIFKDLYKKAVKDFENDQSKENKKRIVACNSIQVAYKCILNSFYGYVMREGSRWFSLEMAAAVCNVGGEIIKLSKELIELLGIPLELDTDGIWCLLPALFPTNIKIGNKNVSILENMLNYFVCNNFTNYQYQEKINGIYEMKEQNSIFFEVDGPYKSMIIPSSTEENKLLKKRYVVFNEDDKIVELKGFELKRRGELNFIKKFQEDIFSHFNDGSNIHECYDSLASVCNYWLDIIYTKGNTLDDESLFYLFSESRNMSRDLDCYSKLKSNILGTARKLAEFLGNDVLEEKLKCEFIMSKYPVDAPTADRAIPVLIFKSAERDHFLKKWLKISKFHSLNEIIDWDYYKKRFENILQRLIVIPAFLQNIKNPISRINLPVWIKNNLNKEKLNFDKIIDIEDSIKKNSLNIFYSGNLAKKLKINENEEILIEEVEPCIKLEEESEPRNIGNLELIDALKFLKERWVGFYKMKLSFLSSIIKIEFNDDSIIQTYLSGNRNVEALDRKILLKVNDPSYFAEYNKITRYDSFDQKMVDLFEIEVSQKNFKSEKFLKFFDHLNVSNFYSFENPLFESLGEMNVEIAPPDTIIVTSFIFQKSNVYCITNKDNVVISEINHPSVSKINIQGYANSNANKSKIVVLSRNDPNISFLQELFKNYQILIFEIISTSFINSFENILKKHSAFHLNLKNLFYVTLDISRFYKIPLLNVDIGTLDMKYVGDNLLDFILYKEFINNAILPIHYNDDGFEPNYIKQEKFVPSYNSNYSIQLEFYDSLILSIIEFKTFQSYHDYEGYLKQDFIVFREFLKKMVLQALKNNSGAKYLMEKISFWIKKSSKLISSNLRDLINSTHQKYILTLISHFKKNQYNVISSTKELIILSTDKKDYSGCMDFLQYVRNTVSQIPGYELLNLSVLRVFEKLAFIDPMNYYAIQDGKLVTFSSIYLPPEFLQLYFSENDIKNENVYDFVRNLDFESVKMLLKVLSYKRDVHGLASNCYKLLGGSKFDEKETFDIGLSVFCRNCGSDNILRERCLKCYNEFEKDLVSDECLKYLKYCWKMQISGDKYCNRCGYYCDRRLKEFCKCGGKFTKKCYIKQIEQLKQFVLSKFFDGEAQKVLDFFK